MARTTPQLVQAILEANQDWNGITPLGPFIDAASVVVDNVVALARERGDGVLIPVYAQQEILERWLAAHIYCQADKTYQSEGVGGANASYTGQTGQGFTSTLYGQMALRLDLSGMLTAIDKRQFASVMWLGKTVSEQLPYSGRS